MAQIYFVLALILLAVLISVEAGSYLIFRNGTRLARCAGVILFGQALDLTCYLLQWISVEPTLLYFFNLIQLLGYTIFCIYWVEFTLVFTRHEHWIKLWYFVLLFTLPILYLSMMATRWLQGSLVNLQGGAMIGSIFFSPLTHGLPGSLFVIFIYGVDIFSVVIMLQFYAKSNSFFRRLILPLLFGPIILASVAIFELFGTNPIYPISIHQLSLASISLVAFWVVFDLRFRSVLSSAREMVVDQMQDGVAILDAQDRIVDLNSAAQRILNPNRKIVLKQKLSQIWPEGAALIAGKSGDDLALEETSIQVNGLDCTFDTNISQLHDAYSEPIGRLIVLRNVTTRERMEKALQERTQELQRANAFISALAVVNVNLQSVSDSAEINTLIGVELKKFGLFCFIAQFNPTSGSDELEIRYLSVLPDGLAQIEKALRSQAIGYRLDKNQFSPLYKIIEGKEISFEKYEPGDLGSGQGLITTAILEQVIPWLGLQPEMPILILPLFTGGHNLGVMGVWGGAFKEADIPPFQIFASQVAHVMERTALYENEIQRSSELARANRLGIALSKVASVMGTTANSALVLDTLGKELNV